MRKIVHKLQAAIVAASFLQLLEIIPQNYFVALNIILLGLSINFEGTQPHTILIVLLTISNSVKAIIPDSILVIVFQTVFIIASAYCLLTFRYYNLMDNFLLHSKHDSKKQAHAGWRIINVEGVPVSVYYPTDKPTGIRPRWINHRKYFQAMLDIMNIDPNNPQIKAPVGVVRRLMSYIEKYTIDVEANAILTESQQSFKVVIFSHGLAAQQNAYSTFARWWARRGYIVFCLQHDHDEIIVDFRNKIKQGNEIALKYIYECRNRDIKIRARQLGYVFKGLTEGNLLDRVFKRDGLSIQGIEFGGHSYGGGSILEAAANLKLSHNEHYQKLVQRLVCLDPWLFPLTESSYTDLKKPILFINSEAFVSSNPQFYELHKKAVRMGSLNPKMDRLAMRGLEHIHQCDFVAIGGNLLQKLGTIKDLKNAPTYQELNVFIIYLFEQGRTGDEIVQILRQELKGVKIGINSGDKLLVKDVRKEWKDPI